MMHESKSARLSARTCMAVLVIALASPLTMSCSKGDASDADVTPVVSVRTEAVRLAPFAHAIQAIGPVVPTPSGYAELSAPTQSRVRHVYAAVGQPVSAGEALVALDAIQLSSASSSAVAAREAARHAYDRATKLAAAGIIPRKAVDQARADLAQTTAAAVAAEHAYSLSMLRSPISGVVTRMSAITGSTVDPSQVLVAIAKQSALQVLLQLSPSDAAAVRVGAAVQLASGEGRDATIIGSGSVMSVGAAIDSATRSVPVRVRVESTTRPLRLGETVVGRIGVNDASRVAAIPAAALVPDGGDQFRVYVVRNGVAYSTPVTVGMRSDSLVEISRGLSSGEIVVTSGAYGLEDSSRVTVVKR